MTVPPKWWLGMVIMWLLIVVVTSFTVEAPIIGLEEREGLKAMASPTASLGGITAVYTAVTGILYWGGDTMPFFQSGVGYYIRLFLLALSAAIVLPLAYDLARLLIPWGR